MFSLYEPANRPHPLGKIIRIAVWAVVLAMVALMITAAFPQLFRLKDSLLEKTFTLNLVLIGLIITGALYYVFLQKKTRRVAVGEMVLSGDGLTVLNEKIPFSALKSLRFIGNDIAGEFRGQETQGTENQILLTLQDGRNLTYNFRQTTAQRLSSQTEFLQKARQLGLLSAANYEAILNNTNYY